MGGDLLRTRFLLEASLAASLDRVRGGGAAEARSAPIGAAVCIECRNQKDKFTFSLACLQLPPLRVGITTDDDFSIRAAEAHGR